MNRQIKLMLTIVLFSVFSYFAFAYAEIPQALSFQAKLTDKDGSPLNGNYKLEFALYDSLTSSNLLWQETQTVPVQEGVANVILGSSNPLDLAFDKPYWLELVIQGEKLSQRQPLLSSAYSLNSAGFQGRGLEDFLLKTPSGAVGIGTATPGRMLDVNGTARFKYNLDLASGNPALGFNRDTTNGDIYDKSHSAWQLVSNPSVNDEFQIQLYNSKGTLVGIPLAIQNNGNVGIGTTGPEAKLEVAGQIKITGGNPKTGNVLTSDANGLASWQAPSGGTNRAWASSSGCGVTCPAGWTEYTRWNIWVSGCKNPPIELTVVCYKDF